ncbi:gamma-mobile-trio integrase GmtZ [Crenobacter cavernae]|uniref:Integrase n=1 Tax=Crenobacter cavernae TaxID=2290923 RepID=A0A345Y8C7_9NEIS|nr:integrase family protein [Crenobacter cavernae]AXK40179.1 hypothetical protein DWG20_12405 [Crenobacter cavernae]
MVKKTRGAKIRGTTLNFDPKFRFLLTLDPGFEAWRQLAAEWWPQQKRASAKLTALAAFFIRYLHGQDLDKLPLAVFRQGSAQHDLWATLELGRLLGREGTKQHDTISDFLEWVLRSHLAEVDADGHRVVPAHLRNPFPRLRPQVTGKGADLSFAHVRALDSRMADWCDLADEWLGEQRQNVQGKRASLDKFFVTYIAGLNLPRNPIRFLHREERLPDFSETWVSSKVKGAIGALSMTDVQAINAVADFLDWVLATKLSIADEHGYRLVPPELHNPVKRFSHRGLAAPTESVRAALSIRYIKELRHMLAEGPYFRDWGWAQQAMQGGNSGGTWFVVDPKLVNRADPDCVWRERETTKYEQDRKGWPAVVTELWSPVRAVALYLKLELPLRTFQVRMLDSGEADTWRYVHGLEGGSFIRNDSPLATGSEARPYQRGVFHRSQREVGAGLFINTNKTADINKAENHKGYVVPWAHEAALYWLEKLRNWQERYNPIAEPMPWRDLEYKQFGGTPPHPEVLEARGTACFLFRDAAADGADRAKPLTANALDRIWYLLLARLEEKCRARSETLDDGTPIQFINPDSDSATHYPLHALRVSLISYLVLDLQLPLPVVSKFIAGHARIIMTLYYTKFGQAYMREVLAEAESKQLQADQQNHARFLMDATLEQVSQRFASLSEDALRAAIGHQSAATFVFEDKGICPVGSGMCDVGGEPLNDSVKPVYGPVPGYPQERNCVRCRFFLTGPAFLPGLQAHFNTLSYEAQERSERHNDLHEEVTLMENRRADCERDGRPFSEARELQRLSQRYEAEAEAMGTLVNDLQATYHLIGRSLEILKQAEKDGVQLVAVGELNDLETAFIETPSELHQIEVLCENAVIYPEIDARKPALRRAQILDLMLEFNNMPPVFFRLTPKQQLAAGNAVMKLIQSRTGSLKGALDYVEGLRRLRELGIVDDTWDAIAEVVAGTPARDIINTARTQRALPNRAGDDHAS